MRKLILILLVAVGLPARGSVGPATLGVTANTVWPLVSNTPIVLTNQQKISSVYTAIFGATTYLNHRLCLASNYTAVVGDEFQLYTRGILESQNPYITPFYGTLQNNTGNGVALTSSPRPRYMEWIPTAAERPAGTTPSYTYTCWELSANGVPIQTNSTTVTLVKVTAQPATQQYVWFLGHSMVTPGIIAAEFLGRLTSSRSAGSGYPAGNNFANIALTGNQSLVVSDAAGTARTVAQTGFVGWTIGKYANTGGPYSGALMANTTSLDATDVGSFWTVNGITVRVVSVITTGGHAGQFLVEAYSGSLSSLPSSGTLTHSSGGTHTTSIAYSAFTATTYVSPFVNPDTGLLDFAYTATMFGHTPTVAYILCVANGLLLPQGGQTDPTQFTADKTGFTTFLTSLHSAWPSCRVSLLGMEHPNVFLSNNYSVPSQWNDYYSLLRSVNGVDQMLQDLCLSTDSTGSWLTYIGIPQVFDSEWNMQTSTAAVNPRNTTTETIGANTIHPAAAGYYQMADACWRNFIRYFCYTP